MNGLTSVSVLLASIALVDLLLASHDAVNPEDQKAWEVLSGISQPAGNITRGESPVGWRLWPMQDEIVPAAGDSGMPVSMTGIFDQSRSLHCELSLQIKASDGPASGTNDDQQQCMVVFLNQPAANYILTNRFYLRSLLIKAAQSPQGIHLPGNPGNVAREIKTI